MRCFAVDDEPMALSLLERTIQEAAPACEVQAFGSAREVLEAVRAGARPDVAFLDIELYDMTGLSLAKSLREYSRDTKIVFVTGYSEYALEAFDVHARGYVLKPVTVNKVRTELENISEPKQTDRSSLRVQTFGYFEVFADGEPMRFAHAKTKELFAYLIDRRGASANTSELCAVLWEDRLDSPSVRSYVRTLLSDLSHALRAAGAEDVLVKRRNSFSVNCERIDCDLYRFLEGDAAAVHAYRGEYLSQYSWAEVTLGHLEHLR